MSSRPESIEELDARIAVVRGNLRELIERASAHSGAADDELMARRIAEQEAQLESLKQRRATLGK